jgi:phage terminase small subunit
MAGAKGRSGGARLGAGRKPKEPDPPISVSADDPLEFLLAVMRNNEATPELRVKAANYALPYKYAKKGEGGKGDEKKRAAKDAGGGKFAPATPPLRLVNSD